jgi:hypothetical protein
MFAYTKLMQAMAAAGVVSATDPYFNLVTLLLPGNGTNGAQNNTFLDSSSNNFSITRNGNTTQGTFSPFSQTGWGNYFSSASGNISIASSANLASGTSSFTLEFWYNSTVTGNGRPIGNGSGAAFGTNNWVFAANNSAGKLEFYVYNYSSSTAMFSSTSTTVASDGQWHHIVLVRSSNTWAMFIDGSRQGSSVTSSVSFNGSSSGITIGYSGVSPETATAFAGYLSNVRFVNGSAVYDPTQTTLTVPTSALTAITNTSLLTCQSNRFVDNSTNAFAITVNGTPSVQAFSPFAPTAAYSAATNGGSGYFDGTGDFLAMTGSAATNFSGVDWTVETWVYINGSSITDYLSIIQSQTGANNWIPYLAVGFRSSLELSLGLNAASYQSTQKVTLNAWNHIAVVRSSGVVKVYLNGAATSVSVTTDINNSNLSFWFGKGDNTPGGGSAYAFLNGYMCGTRFVKGTAVYTAAFTPPTAPLTAITNTSLLLNFTNGGIIDATGKNDLETVGNAQISTTQSKFGGSSMSFDGTGDYLVAPASVLNNVFPADVTIECWVYFNSVANTPHIWNIGTATTNRMTLYVTSSKFALYSDTGTGSNKITGTTTLSTGQWYYVAIVKSGSTFTLYVNGASEGTSTTTAYPNASNLVALGFNNFGSASGDYLNGYIDDFRITRFARTISTPTAAFPVQ